MLRLAAVTSPVIIAEKKDGATTVTTTLRLLTWQASTSLQPAALVAFTVAPETTMDISADLEELAQTPVMVICAGAKSILDLGPYP